MLAAWDGMVRATEVKASRYTLQQGLPQARTRETKTVLQADRTESPPDFYIFPALLFKQLLGDNSATGFVNPSHSISNHIDPLPNSSLA